MEIHESSEDCLDKILMLKEKPGVVRPIDIVNMPGISSPASASP